MALLALEPEQLVLLEVGDAPTDRAAEQIIKAHPVFAEICAARPASSTMPADARRRASAT